MTLSIPQMASLGAVAYGAGSRFGRWYKGYRNRQISIRRPTRSYRGSRKKSYKGVDKKFLKNYLKLTETKFLDTSFTKTPVAGTSDVVGISFIGAGDLDDDRDGEVVLATSVQVLLNLLADANLITDVNSELILLQMKDVRGTAPSVTDVWKTDSINSLREVTNSVNFKILKRWRFHQAHPAIVGSRQTGHFRLFYKFKTPLRLKYLSGDADVTAIDRNGLFLICMTDAGATFLPNFTANVRLSFKDI